MAAHPQNPHEPGEPGPDVIARGHEHGDVRLRAILIAAVILVVATVCIQAGVYVLMESTAKSHDLRSEPASPLLTRNADNQIEHPLPPGPLLQPFSPEHPNLPFEDYKLVHDNAQHNLTTYGVTPADPNDPNHARIPIDRAIELMVQNGVDHGGKP